MQKQFCKNILCCLAVVVCAAGTLVVIVELPPHHEAPERQNHALSPRAFDQLVRQDFRRSTEKNGVADSDRPMCRLREWAERRIGLRLEPADR